MIIKFDGKSTGVGAYAEGLLFNPDGQGVEPSNTETSRTGNHWTHIWRVPDGTYLLCVSAENGRGRDDSYTEKEGPEPLTYAQELVRKDFLQQHGQEG